MAKELKLKEPKTKEKVDDNFETWIECAHELGLLNVYRVINYYCPEGSNDVTAITFAINLESLIAHAKNILEEDKLQQPRFAT